MNTQQAILASILAEPDDDVHRLAYADCCEEQGDFARAEFIRVQMELQLTACEQSRKHAPDLEETMTPAVLCDDSGCLHCRLQRRARVLLWAAGGDGSGLAWLDQADWPLSWEHLEEGLPPRWSWERGFVVAVDCFLREWLAHGPTLVGSQPLAVVRLRDRVCRERPLASPVVWSWTCADPVTFPVGFPWFLPQAIFAALPGPPCNLPGLPAKAGLDWKEYATPRQARSALSQALLSWARHESSAATAAENTPLHDGRTFARRSPSRLREAVVAAD
jgi:uncharacterized protein (TIGR02996 family)